MIEKTWNKYYNLVDIKKVDDKTMVLLKFKLPPVSIKKRKSIIKNFFDESGADALIEIFWTKGSIIHKDKYQFYVILIFNEDNC
ncbi:MAG: hypothetical protein QXS29_06060 [Nitrososphaeria archaeon]